MSAKKGRDLADVMAAIDDDELGITVDEPAAPAVGKARKGPDIVPVNFFVTPEDRRRLRQLSLDTGLSVQKLCHEGLNRMLSARGLPPLEAVSANVPSGRSRH
jgi:Antitoxin-like ribbon-helix-helix